MIKRLISILVRQNKRRKIYKKRVAFVETAMNEIKQIPINATHQKILMLVRMDEIGDYILYRNMLPIIRSSEKFGDHKIVYVGNITTKDLAETLDGAYIDQFIWVNKNLFKNESYYRTELFKSIREIAPSSIIELERTSDVNYGNLIVFASHATKRYGCANHYENDIFNQLSDSFYTDIYSNDSFLENEFQFNQNYINWICDTHLMLARPTIQVNAIPEIFTKGTYIVCVINTSKENNSWPLTSWMIFLKRFVMEFDGKIIILGDEKESADKIVKLDISPNIISMVTKCTLLETLSLIKNARLMVSNDTFAIHAAVACGKVSTVAMAERESTYRLRELQNYAKDDLAISPKYYQRKIPLINSEDRWFYSVASINMETIYVNDVLKKCQELLQQDIG